MSCVYNYKGKVYSDSEIREELKNNPITISDKYITTLVDKNVVSTKLQIGDLSPYMNTLDEQNKVIKLLSVFTNRILEFERRKNEVGKYNLREKLIDALENAKIHYPKAIGILERTKLDLINIDETKLSHEAGLYYKMINYIRNTYGNNPDTRTTIYLKDDDVEETNNTEKGRENKGIIEEHTRGWEDDNNISTKGKMLRTIKGFIALLNEKDDNLKEIIDSKTGLPIPVEYDTILTYMRSRMYDIFDIASMIKRLEQLAKIKPVINSLINKVNSDKYFASGLYSQLKNDVIDEVYLSLKDEEGNITTSLKLSNKRPAYTIANEWIRIVNDKYKYGNYNNTNGSILSRLLSYTTGNKPIDDIYLSLLNSVSKFTDIKVDDFIKLDDTTRYIKVISAISKYLGLSINEKVIRLSTKELTIASIENKVGKYLGIILGEVLASKIEIDVRGSINVLAEIQVGYSLDGIDLSYRDVTGNGRYSIKLPSYISNFFNKANNPDYVNVFNAYLKTLEGIPEFQYSNWATKDKNGNVVFDVNFFRQMTVSMFGGLSKDEGATYQQLNTLDWTYSLLALYTSRLYNEDKTRARIPSMILSDSPKMILFNIKKVLLDTDEYDASTDVIDRNSELWQQVKNTFRQEVARMNAAAKLMFKTDENGFVVLDSKGKLQLKKGLDVNKLQVYYHFKEYDDKGKPILLDKKGNPTGNVFKFWNMGSINDIKDSNDASSIFTKGVLHYKEDSDVEVEELINKQIDANINEIIKSNIKIFNQFRNEYLELKDTEYKKLIAEMALNTYLAYVEQQNFWLGNTAEYKDPIDVTKRAKQIIAPGWNMDTNLVGENFNASIIHNIVGISPNIETMTILLKTIGLSKDRIENILRGYHNIDKADAQGWITVDRKAKILIGLGLWEQYKHLFNVETTDKGENYSLKPNLNLEDVRDLLQPEKGYLYQREYDEVLNRLVSVQFKYSTVPLLPQLTANNPELEVIRLHMENKGTDELLVLSAVKEGAIGVQKIHTEDEKLDVEVLKKLTHRSYSNNEWKRQQVVPDHILDESNKLPIQLSKLILTNINDNTIYKFTDGKEKTGKEIKEYFHKIVSELIKLESDEVYNDTNDIEKIRQVLIKELNTGRGTINNQSALDTNEDGTIKLGLSFNTYIDKWISILTSRYSNAITDLRTPGIHAVAMSNVFTDVEVGVKLNYNKDEHGRWVADIMLPAWSSKYYKEGDVIDINSLPTEALTMVGNRIPTSSKHSASIFRVVKFLPKLAGSTVIVPEDLVTRMGMDFDIDSLFFMVKNTYKIKGINNWLKVIDKSKLDDEVTSLMAYVKNHINEYIDDNEIRQEYLDKVSEVSNDKLVELLNKYDEVVDTIEEGEPLKYGEAILKAGIDTYIRDIRPMFALHKYDETNINNSKVATQNELVNIFETILGNNEHLEEQIDPVNFDESFNAGEDIRTWNKRLSKDKVNPVRPEHQIALRNKVFIGKNMIPLGASLETGLAVLQTVNARLTGNNIVIKKFERSYDKGELERLYGIDNVKEVDGYYYVSMYNLGQSNTGSKKGINGKHIVSNIAQVVDHATDALKKDLPDNYNEHTFNAFVAACSTDGDVRFAMMLINQPIVRTATIRYFESEAIWGSISGRREIEDAKGKYKARILGLMFVNLGTPKVKEIMDTLEIPYNTLVYKYNRGFNTNLFREDEFNRLTNYLQKEFKVQYSKDYIFSTEELEGEYENQHSEQFKILIQHYLSQLMVIEQFKNYNKIGKTISNHIQFLNFDKVGAEFDTTFKAIDSIGRSFKKKLKSEYEETFKDSLPPSIKYNIETGKIDNIEYYDIMDTGITVEVNGINVSLAKAVYPFMFEGTDKSVYESLESYYKYSNLRALQTLGKEFITVSDSFRYTMDYLMDKIGNPVGKRGEFIKSRISSFLLRYLIDDDIRKKGKITETEVKRILGIDMKIPTMDENMNIDEFRNLSAAAMLRVYRLKKGDVSDITKHITSYLDAVMISTEIEKNGFHKIEYNNPYREKNLANNLIISLWNMITSTDEFERVLAENLIQYNFLTSGFAFTSTSYGSLIPTKIFSSDDIMKGRYNIASKLREYNTEFHKGNGFTNLERIEKLLISSTRIVVPVVKGVKGWEQDYRRSEDYGNPSWMIERRNEDLKGMIVFPDTKEFTMNMSGTLIYSDYIRRWIKYDINTGKELKEAKEYLFKRYSGITTKDDVTYRIYYPIEITSRNTYLGIEDKALIPTDKLNVSEEEYVNKLKTMFESPVSKVQPIEDKVYPVKNIDDTEAPIQTRIQFGKTTQSVSKGVEISSNAYTKSTPNDKSKGFFFTENLQAYLANRGRGTEVRFDLHPSNVKLDVTATNNQAGIRQNNGVRNLNTFAIISKKYQQNSSGSFVKEEGQFKDTTEDFELFKKYNTEAINEAIAYNKPLVIAAAGIATGKSALPLRFAEWLNNELKNKLGIQGKVKENTSQGYKGYGIFNLTTSIQQPTSKEVKSGFQGYKGGFEDRGKGTVEGDSKDKAMRQVADGFIGEVSKSPYIKTSKGFELNPNHSSTVTSANEINKKSRNNIGYTSNEPSIISLTNREKYDEGIYPKIIMLARNKERRGISLHWQTRDQIKDMHKQGTTFVVGDMPDVDSQFIDYLQTISAAFTIYHTGKESRIKVISKDNTTTSQLLSTGITQKEITDFEKEKGMTIDEYINSSNQIWEYDIQNLVGEIKRKRC